MSRRVLMHTVRGKEVQTSYCPYPYQTTASSDEDPKIHDTDSTITRQRTLSKEDFSPGRWVERRRTELTISIRRDFIWVFFQPCGRTIIRRELPNSWPSSVRVRGVIIIRFRKCHVKWRCRRWRHQKSDPQKSCLFAFHVSSGGP